MQSESSWMYHDGAELTTMSVAASMKGRCIVAVLEALWDQYGGIARVVAELGKGRRG